MKKTTMTILLIGLASISSLMADTVASIQDEATALLTELTQVAETFEATPCFYEAADKLEYLLQRPAETVLALQAQHDETTANLQPPENRRRPEQPYVSLAIIRPDKAEQPETASIETKLEPCTAFF